ncbi:phosphotriesterase-related protein, partial [Salmonella enterica subsp. enterica serovar Poona]
MKGFLQTVTGPVAHTDMGLTLPHEHLFNDLSSVVDEPHYAFSQQLVGKKVSADLQWGLKHDPYCCADNMDRKEIDDVIFEINNFMSLGGRTIVDATGSESIGRDASALREVALKTGLNIVASSGPYLEKFESTRIHKPVELLASLIDKELNQGIGETDIRAGMIGEIGVSPAFTQAARNSLRAAALALWNDPHP